MATWRQFLHNNPGTNISSLDINKKGGVYIRGKAYSETKRESVTEIFEVIKNHNSNERVQTTDVAQVAKVSYKTAHGILKAYKRGDNIKPKSQYKNRPLGPGSKKGLSEEHESYILWLRFQDPFRTNMSYVREMRRRYGISISRTFVSRYFKERFERKGRSHLPNLVPMDKYKISNIMKYDDYLFYISGVNNRRLFFCDEKSLKGSEIYNRRGRADPFSSEKLIQYVTGDFRNVYCVMGMVSVQRRKSKPMVFSMGKSTIYYINVIYLLIFYFIT